MLILIIILFIASLMGCTMQPDISKESSDEEICLAIKTDFLRDKCLAYVKEDPNICGNVGCYALARKLKDGTICTTNAEDRTNYWDSSGTVKKVTSEDCQEFAEMDDAEYQKNYQNIVSELSDPNPYIFNPIPYIEENEKNISKSEILSQTVNEICDLDKKDCYGGCPVSQAHCIMAVALVKNDYEICKKMRGRVAWADDCYHIMAFINDNVEICNFARRYTRDECYLDFVTKGINYVYISFERDKRFTENP